MFEEIARTASGSPPPTTELFVWYPYMKAREAVSSTTNI
jgi:hypothetical protein